MCAENVVQYLVIHNRFQAMNHICVVEVRFWCWKWQICLSLPTFAKCIIAIAIAIEPKVITCKIIWCMCFIYAIFVYNGHEKLSTMSTAWWGQNEWNEWWRWLSHAGNLQWWHVYWDKLLWYNKIFSFLVNKSICQRLRIFEFIHTDAMRAHCEK